MTPSLPGIQYFLPAAPSQPPREPPPLKSQGAALSVPRTDPLYGRRRAAPAPPQLSDLSPPLTAPQLSALL